MDWSFYLIQRVPVRDYSVKRFWADRESAFQLDYMGSAEFEFGTVPASLKRLLALIEAGQLRVDTIEINGKTIDLAYPSTGESPKTFFRDWVARGLEHKITTKAYPSYFFGHLRGDEPRANPKLKKQATAYALQVEDINALFWSLEDDVLFGFAEAGNVRRFISEARDVIASRAQTAS